MKFKYILTILLLILLLTNKVGGVNAQYYSQSNVSKSISLDKKVRNVHDDKYLDNIDLKQNVFYESDLIEFKITVLNNGNEDLNNLAIIDNLPSNLSLIFYPGTLDKDNNKLSWSIDKLKAGESRDYLIRAKITDLNKLLIGDINTKMLVNKSSVTTDNINDNDAASFYVGNKIIPKTGDNTLVAKTMILLISMASAGYIRKFARGY